MTRQIACFSGRTSLVVAIAAAVFAAASPSFAQFGGYGSWQGAYPAPPQVAGAGQHLSQKAINKVPPVVSPVYNEPDLFQPFVDPLSFDSDFQLFAPVDLSLYGGPPPPNTGWYFSYGREYINMSMPEQTANGGDPFARPFDGEWLWGNRYDMGYMTEQNHGWNITYAYVNQGMLVDDPDLFIKLKPLYHSLEISKTFRKQLRFGGFLEPYFGVRYIYFSDTQTDSSEVGLGSTSEFMQKMQNQIIGGQIGCRYRVRKGRWNLSSDMKVFGGQNFQFAQVRDLDTLLGVSSVNDSYDEFVPVGEFRFEAAYEVTRDISLKAGMGLVHVVRGMLRADTSPFETNPNNPNNNLTDQLILVNDQDLTLVGATFGIEYNR